MRRVKIVATLGPATSTPERIRELLLAGVDVVRMNFSHGSHQEHERLIHIVRQVAGEMERPVAVLQDLQGPRIRTHGIPDGKLVELVSGQEFLLGPGGVASTTYPDLYRVVVPGQRILLDDGRMEVRVVAVAGQQVRCQVVNGGLLGANKGVNLPGVVLDLPSFSAKDRADLDLGLGLGVDWIALSFVRQGEDVKPVREVLRRHRVRLPILAKIEKPEALHNLDDILRAFDGIMVARGDLGVELSPEEVPVWQKDMIRRARRMGKVSIVATQMLESMMGSPRPTRAEASDVANAVLDGADAVQLSGETSVGLYPVQAVSVMSRIIEKTETAYPPYEVEPRGRPDVPRAVAHAACLTARELGSRAIVVLTRSGTTARLVSRNRPQAPIIALAGTTALARQLALWWGVSPLVMEFSLSTEATLASMEEALLNRGLARPGDDIIVVGSAPFLARGRPNFVKVHRVGKPG